MKDNMKSLGPVRKWLLAKALSGELSPWLRRRALADEIIRSAYNGVRRVENARSTHASAGRRRAISQAIFADTTSRKMPSWAMGTLTFAAAAAAIFVVAIPKDSDWTPRGGNEGALGLRVRCVQEEQQGPVIVDETILSWRGGGRASLLCQRDALLAFSATNLTGVTQNVFLVGITQSGELRWYHPFAADGRSAEIGKGSVDEMLPELANMSNMPHDPQVTLFALFSEEPLSGDEIERAVKRMRSQGVSLSSLDRLPVGIGQQGRADLRFLPVERK